MPVAPVARVKVPAPVSIPAVQVKAGGHGEVTAAVDRAARQGEGGDGLVVVDGEGAAVLGDGGDVDRVRCGQGEGVALTRVAALPFTAPVMVSDDALFDRVVPADRSRVSMVLVPLPA